MLAQLAEASQARKQQEESKNTSTEVPEPKIEEKKTEEQLKQEAKEKKAKENQKKQMQAVVDHYLKKKETQDQALDSILQFSGAKETRDIIVGTDVCKQLLRLVHQEGCTQRVFKSLINLSQDDVFARELAGLNLSRRVFDFLVENVKQDMGSSSNNKDIKLDRSENAYIIDDKSNDMSSTIFFAIMLLSNVTKIEEGCLNILGKDKQEGVVLENLFGMFSYFDRDQSFDFVANVLSNITSTKEARVYMIKSKLLDRIMDLLKDTDKLNTHRKQHLIDAMRNTLFEYDDFEKEFIERKYVDRIVKLLIEEQGMTEKRLPVRLHNMKASKEKKPDQIDHYRTSQLIDSLVILSNLPQLQVRMVELNVEGLVKHLKIAAFGDTPQKVEMILVQLQTTRQENPHLQVKYDEEAKESQEKYKQEEEVKAKAKEEEEAKKKEKSAEQEVEFTIDTSQIKNVPLQKDELGQDDVDRWLNDQADAFANF